MRIRQMTQEDVERVAEIEAACFSTPWSVRVYQETLANENAFYLVAEEEILPSGREQIIGMCGVMNILGEGDISNVAVLEEFRGRGIASALFERLLDYCRVAGMTSLILEVRESNLPAVRLYEHAGFVCVGKRKHFYDKPTEDALMMVCRL